MPDARSDRFREIRYTLLWLVGIALIFLFVWYAWELLFLAFAGLLLAILLRTIADWIERHSRLSENASYAATVCGSIALVGLAAWLIVPNVISQGAEIVKIIPLSMTQARDYLDRYDWGRYVVQFARRAPQNLDLAPKIAALTAGLVDAVAAAIVVVIVGFYAGWNPSGYTNALLRLLPEEHRERAMHVGSEVVYTLRWWLLGQLVPMAALGVFSMIGLWILGVPLAFTLGLFTAVMVFIPYLGALLSEIPAVLVALKQGPTTMVYVLILYLGVHALEGYVITPLVQKRAVRLLPILTILAQFLMWILTGALGVAIATPLAAAGLVLVKMLYLHEEIEH